MPTSVLLIHHDNVPVPPYRIQNYKYLYSYLARHGYDLLSCADDRATYDRPGFPITFAKIGFAHLVGLIRRTKPRVCLLVVNHSQPYFYFLLAYLRIKGIKTITWTHGTNFQRSSRIGDLAHHLEHELCDGIVLYAEHTRRHLLQRHNRKAFVANNTLNLTEYLPPTLDRSVVLARHGIHTAKNVICVGRVQARKRIPDLLAAFRRLTVPDCGLIIVGPDEEGILRDIAATEPRVHALGPLYGQEVLDLMSCADVYCIPGAIGLSIVDAMFCGLPVVTECVVHGPEIMYLHEGENGFMVPAGDIAALADRLSLLLTNEELRRRFAERSRLEIATRGHIDELCKGIRECIDYVTSADR